jgi:ArsR family transcriptional regulator
MALAHLLLVPGTVEVEFAADPVYNNLTSLYLIALANSHSGFAPWIEEAAARLAPETMQTHRVLFDLLYSAYEPAEDWPSFPAYLESLQRQPPQQMRERFLRHMFAHLDADGHQAVLEDLDLLMTEMDRSELDQEVEPELFARAHALLSDPPALHQTVVAHLTAMWRDLLAEEWERIRPLLAQTVAFYRSQPYPAQNAYDAVKSITGRDVQNHWQHVLAPAQRLRFIPSVHVGPYLMHVVYPPLVRILFGVRLPPGAAQGPVELSRADLLVQLRALADDTRLRILDLLRAEGELCAQEIIARLDLTKSNASRHLSQLSAGGYLVERQRPGKVKCYALNPARLRETMRALEWYAQDAQ